MLRIKTPTKMHVAYVLKCLEIKKFCFSRNAVAHNFFDHDRNISSVGRVLDCKAGGLGFDYQGHTNNQGQK